MRQHGGAGPYIGRKCSAGTLMFRAGNGNVRPGH